ncbi:hypothetical protein R1sor_007298 [Riccia sorocarpa]|uniref:DDE Tnp4 domain-containing protein n=1 Tax=Riccia sorocarpa TaxID=122646 RepID=A0ABD3HQ13_9MARC
MHTVVVASHVLVDRSFHVDQGWWVKERNLIWFDYYLWSAYEEERWVRCLRVPKELLVWLVARLTTSIKKQDTHFRFAVPVEVRVAVTLFRIATGSSYFITGDRFGIGESTCQEIVQETIQAIVTVLGSEMIYWPRGVEMERESVVTINGDFQLKPYILGDSGYTQESWLMCPYSLNRNSSPQQRLFTERQIRGRIVVEQAFGILKSRFRILDVGISSSITWAATVVQACCIMHNFLIRNRLSALDRNIADQNMRKPRGGGGVPDTHARHNGHLVRDALAQYLFATQ